MTLQKKLSSLMVISLLAMAVSFSSCRKDPADNNPEVQKFVDLNVAEDFVFDANKKITINFTVLPATTAEAPHIIKIYSGDPANGGKLINTGITDDSYLYSVTFSLPDRLSSIYVENRTMDGIYEIVPVALTSNEIDHVFNSLKFWFPEESPEKGTIVDPGCGSDCDETLSGTYENLLLDKDNYCVAPGTSLAVTGTLTFKRQATLVVCGNLTVNNIATNESNKKGKLYISGSGTITSSGNLELDSQTQLYNFGVANFNGHVTTTYPAEFHNYETMNIAGNFYNNTHKFENNGTLNVSGNYINGELRDGDNYATMNVAGNFILNEQSDFRNYCKLIVSGNLVIEDEFRNYSYVKVSGTTTISEHSSIKMDQGSLLNTNNLIVDGDIDATGNGYSKIEINQNTTLNESSKVKNKIDLCDANGIEVSNGFIHQNVVYCDITIPENSCNPGSTGNNGGGNDADDDGVPDEEDDYPEDPNRAFDNYYPNEIDYSSLAYEDLWPGLGDYDFNDLVIDFQYQMVTNASNKIVDIIASTHVKAAGATLNNGFGVAYPVSPDNVATVSGYRHATSNLDLNAKGYENGHTDETVVIYYDAVNTIYNSSIFNTVPGGNWIETDTITVTTTFSEPTLSIGEEPYNPFIYVNQERGKEIHLVNKPPTALASGYFGTMHDNSDASTNRYYVTENNLPWGIETPESFEYPIEKVDILEAYLKFSSWATSSGDLFDDWYLDEPGYRDDNNIFEVE